MVLLVPLLRCCVLLLEMMVCPTSKAQSLVRVLELHLPWIPMVLVVVAAVVHQTPLNRRHRHHHYGMLCGFEVVIDCLSFVHHAAWMLCSVSFVSVAAFGCCYHKRTCCCSDEATVFCVECK